LHQPLPIFPSQDIFRKYPNKYESIISTLCENLDTLDEPEARASMIWIIGEYAERIDNADELLESFLDGFGDENTQVSLSFLSFTFCFFSGFIGIIHQLILLIHPPFTPSLLPVLPTRHKFITSCLQHHTPKNSSNESSL
jgi:hypothetical protein